MFVIKKLLTAVGHSESAILNFCTTAARFVISAPSTPRNQVLDYIFKCPPVILKLNNLTPDCVNQYCKFLTMGTLTVDRHIAGTMLNIKEVQKAI